MKRRPVAPDNSPTATPRPRAVKPRPPVIPDNPPTAKWRPQTAPDTAPEPPRRRSRFWRDDQEPQAMAATASEAAPEEPYRFSKLREDAWDRFLSKSADLAAAHPAEHATLNNRHRRPTAWLLTLLHRLLTIAKGPKRTALQREIPETPEAPAMPKNWFQVAG